VLVVTQNIDDLHERAGQTRCCTCMASCSRRSAPIAATSPNAARTSRSTRTLPRLRRDRPAAAAGRVVRRDAAAHGGDRRGAGALRDLRSIGTSAMSIPPRASSSSRTRPGRARSSSTSSRR
jgi:hypothetical protein